VKKEIDRLAPPPRGGCPMLAMPSTAQNRVFVFPAKQ